MFSFGNTGQILGLLLGPNYLRSQNERFAGRVNGIGVVSSQFVWFGFAFRFLKAKDSMQRIDTEEQKLKESVTGSIPNQQQ